jgi:Transglutaminase-like superfamily
MRLRIFSCLLVASSLCGGGNNGSFFVVVVLTGGITTSSSTSTRTTRIFVGSNPDVVTASADNLRTVKEWCRSNETHIAWRTSDANILHGEDDDCNDDDCAWQSYEKAYREAYDYLRANIMDFDEPNMETLGFQREEANNSTPPDGLANGLIQPVIELSLRTKRDFAHTDALPREIWNNYVLNYANLNEARSNIRPWLHERVVVPLLLDNDANREANVSEVVRLLNTHAWPLISLNNQTIHFVASQTPLIFDPMSILVFGYASYTGLAILLVHLLRAAGIAARVAGTPAWNANVEHGNHNWVEVYNRGEWYFLEPSPSVSVVDTLDRNPCERWFCHGDRLMNGTQFYAAQLSRSNDSIYFPLSWEWDNRHVPAENRTEYYHRICSQCDRVGGGGSSSDNVASASRTY